MAEGVFDLASPSGRRSLILYSLGALLGLGLAGFALFTAKGTLSNALPPEDLALVNGRPVLISDFIAQTEVETGLKFQETTREQRLRVANAMIDEELLVQRGLEVDLAAFDPEVRAAMVSGVSLQVAADVLARQTPEAELRAYYETHKDKYSSSGVMKLWDLVAPVRPDQTEEQALAKATAASRALAAGMTPETAIQRFGLVDTMLIDKEENFDFGVKARLGDALYAEAEKVEAGSASAPIKNTAEQYTAGYHVIVMLARTKAVPMTFEKARDNVVVDLTREARAKVDGDNIAFLRKEADIKIAPEYAQ